jgi:hypothetical protein
MDIFKKQHEIKKAHFAQRHVGGNKGNVQGNLECNICYGIKRDNIWKDLEVPEEFKRFWKILNKTVKGIAYEGYNWITINGFYDLISDKDQEIEEDRKDKIAIRTV